MKLKIHYHHKIVSLMGPIELSGDLIIIKEDDNCCYIGLIDGLGHGEDANSAASLAIDYLEDNFHPDLSSVIVGTHKALQNSRGAVMALCCLSKTDGVLKYCGIGNITTRILRPASRTFAPKDGIVGHNIPSPRIETDRMLPGDVLMLSSDGITERIDQLDFAGLLLEDAESITKKLYQLYKKDNDDASIVIVKVTR